MNKKVGQKYPVHAYLSENSHTGWHDYAEDNGVSITGLIEALGVMLFDANGVQDWFPDWVKEGRRIDVERRRRG